MGSQVKTGGGGTGGEAGVGSWAFLVLIAPNQNSALKNTFPKVGRCLLFAESLGEWSFAGEVPMCSLSVIPGALFNADIDVLCVSWLVK